MGFAEIPGDASEVATVAAHFRLVADEVGAVRDQLTAARSAPANEWQGSAGDSFRSTLGDFPDKFWKVWHAFDHVAYWLWWYENQLRDLKAQQARKGDAVNAARQSEQDLHQRKSADDPANGAHWDAQITQARAEGDGLERDAQGLYEEWYAGPLKTCCDRINEAGDWAFANWSDRYLVDDVGGAAVASAETIGHVVVNVAVGAFKAAWDLPGHLADFARHPSWHGASEILADVTAVVGIAAIFVPELLLVDLGSNLAQAGVDAEQAATGKGDWGSVGWDAFSVATGGAAGVAGRGASLGRRAEALEGAKTRAVRGAPAEDTAAITRTYLGRIGSLLHHPVSSMTEVGEVLRSSRKLARAGARDLITHPLAKEARWTSAAATRAMVRLHRIEVSAHRAALAGQVAQPVVNTIDNQGQPIAQRRSG